MNRRFSWRLRCPCLVTGALLCFLEGVSFAREPAPPPPARSATAAREGHPARTTPVSGAREAGRPSGSSGTVAQSERLAFAQAIEQGLAQMAVCHISHHPLDGLRSSEHACPLLLADAGATPSYALGVFTVIFSRML
jgi:hypothetical protein